MYPNKSFIEKSEKLFYSKPVKENCYLLYLDISDFQYINFRYGPEAGDRLLMDVENHMSGLPFVLLCEHLYSDYFLSILSFPRELSDEDAVQAVENGLRELLDEQQKLYPACKLHFFSGISHADTRDTQALARSIECANLARKEARRLDLGRAVLYSEELAKKTFSRYELEQTLNLAIQEHRFCFYLQPKVDLTNGRIIGAEALARRIGRDGAIIYPDSFLPVMESAGTVVELDFLICRQVCAFLSERLERGLPVVRTSVNLSRLHINNKNTAASLHSIAQEYHIPPELLEFELTETILLDELSGAKNLIDQLRAYGYCVSIDDFGSGYAGINIWQELDFDCLKLDGCFLSEEPELKKKNEALVPNIINIGQRLNISILCEGVETAKQCAYLTRLGCTTVQGFYFSRPVSPEIFYDTYRKQNGCYALPFKDFYNTAQENQDERVLPENKKNSQPLKPRWYLPLSLCSVFMGLCVILATVFYHNLTRKQFNDMVLENLDACMKGQKANILSVIDNAEAALESLSILVSQQDDPALTEAYLLSLNQNDPLVTYSWLSAEELYRLPYPNAAQQENQTVLERLRQGETVVSDIVYSHRPDDSYYYAVAVPFFINDTFAGALRNTINAENLTSTALFPSSQGSVIDAFITDGAGTVIPVRKDDTYATLSECIAGLDIQPDRHAPGAGAVSSMPSGNWKIGSRNGIPIYLSRIDLGFNDWHLTVLYGADKVAARSNSIIMASLYCTGALFVAIVLIYLIIFVYMKKMQKKFSMEEQRYLLLEQFSDTVLFDYDCRKDTIRFTPNADRLFKIHDLVQQDFLQRLDAKYVYAGDMETIQTLLSGKSIQKEVRLRLLHPSENRYFWCLAQFRYLFEQDVLVSIVGKITDIDEQKLHEDYLIEISEKDGLTGLRNKASAIAKIRESILNNSDGVLFMIDVDNFKQINDQYGHTAGDSALIFLAECLQKTFRSNDVLGRAGGDELIAYMEGVHDRNIAAKKVELLMYYIRQSTSQGIPFTSVSVGISLCPDDGLSYEELFAAADQAMYQAKNKGKMQAQFYNDTI